LTVRRPLSPAAQQGIKAGLGLLTAFVGLRATWISLGGGFGPVMKQLVIVVLAMILGRLAGRGLGLQKLSNRLGQFAKTKISEAGGAGRRRFNDGFIVCAVLFCVGPMAILGAVQDGLASQWQTLAIKAALDGLVAMAFVPMFGWGVLVAVIPVVAFQGTVTLGSAALAPYLQQHALLDAVTATAGLLVFSIALVIWEVKKVEFADYLPSLAFAPLLAWVWR